MCGYTFFYANVPGIVTRTVNYRGTVNVALNWRFCWSLLAVLISAFVIL